MQKTTHDTAVNHRDSNKQYREDVQESTHDTVVNHTDSNKQYREDVQESTHDTYMYRSQSVRQQQAVQRGRSGINVQNHASHGDVDSHVVT